MQCILSAATIVASLVFAIQQAGAVTVSGSYYEDTIPRSCSNATTCNILFAQLPASTSGLFVTITEVGCTVFTDKVLTDAFIEVTDAGTNGRRQHPLDIPERTGNASFNEHITFKITGGPPRQPRIIIGAGNGAPGLIQTLCTIVGTISSE